MARCLINLERPSFNLHHVFCFLQIGEASQETRPNNISVEEWTIPDPHIAIDAHVHANHAHAYSIRIPLTIYAMTHRHTQFCSCDLTWTSDRWLRSCIFFRFVHRHTLRTPSAHTRRPLPTNANSTPCGSETATWLGRGVTATNKRSLDWFLDLCWV